ncbi:MAG: hypothetical protein LBR34_01530 [Prevotella sp.]|nr:hypothetical protein [Prevotella sp.]
MGILSLISLINRQLIAPVYEGLHLKEEDTSALCSCDNFPVEVGGVWYFESEDEARGFIKKIIGF